MTAGGTKSTNPLYFCRLVKVKAFVYAVGMTQPMRDLLRALLPHLDDAEFEKACECFTRYIQLAAQISMRDMAAGEAPLTQAEAGASVRRGLVDPSTFTNTG